MRSSISTDRYDVIVLGSGISGGLVSAILAHKGFKVAIVDAAMHPKFAIGESTIETNHERWQKREPDPFVRDPQARASA